VQLPLYRVNLGVVSSSRNWEPHLDHIFDCAYSWNAILLIDEAEVVLEERTFRGKDQNTWVSGSFLAIRLPASAYTDVLIF